MGFLKLLVQFWLSNLSLCFEHRSPNALLHSISKGKTDLARGTTISAPRAKGDPF